MHRELFIAYYRVSTSMQGQSGLGLEAQKAAVAKYLSTKEASEIVKEFTEIETGKGANALEKRPQLRAALAACKKHGATLIIAKLDRLARNVHFVSGLLETGVDFIAADMPQANKVMIQMHSVMAEWERDQISARTKAALTAAKARGVALGVKGPENLRRNIEERKAKADEFAHQLIGILIGFKAQGLSQRQMVEELNKTRLPAPKGGAWSLIQLQRVLKRNRLSGQRDKIAAD
jgi:DNA invertase Pin-like site-specific DNA recombinase